MRFSVQDYLDAFKHWDRRTAVEELRRRSGLGQIDAANGRAMLEAADRIEAEIERKRRSESGK